MEFYANSKGQLLYKHLHGVGSLAVEIYKKCVNDSVDNGYIEILYLSGVLHDIGKVDKKFQSYILNQSKKTDFSFEKYPRHNEISLFLFNKMYRYDSDLSLLQKDIIRHVIYWHHSKIYRKTELKNLNKLIDCNYISNSALSIIKSISELDPLISKYIGSYNENKDDISSPLYKNYQPSFEDDDFISDINYNSETDLIRSCVISADRIISSLSAYELEDVVETKEYDKLIKNVDNIINLDGYINGFLESDRSIRQQETALDLSYNSFNILSGPAGCGKTNIALKWAKLTHAKKIWWVCPRVNVCYGIYNDLKDKLPNVEIYTGEYKLSNYDRPEDTYLDGNIIITTIDQINNAIISHTKVDTLLDLCTSHVVIDEWHEIVNIPGFNVLLAELIRCLEKSQNNNTLMVSATPNYRFIELLNLDNPVKIESFNPSQYRIEFDVYREGDKCALDMHYDNSTAVITNTAKDAQMGFINNPKENNILIHSKFRKDHKSVLFDKVIDCFGYNGTKEYDVLRSGPIVQSSLNITFDHIVTDISSPENILQRLGRLDRFGYNIENVMTICVELPDNGLKSSQGRFNSNTYCYNQSKAFYEHFCNEDFGAHTLNRIYDMFDEMYNNKKFKLEYEKDFVRLMNDSLKLINKKVLGSKLLASNISGDIRHLSKNSLRGNNVYVNMVVVDYRDGEYIRTNEYAADTVNTLTMERGDIENNDMVKNNIEMKRELDKSTSSDRPLYLSYTDNDIGNCKSVYINDVYYYVITDKQPVGICELTGLSMSDNIRSLVV